MKIPIDTCSHFLGPWELSFFEKDTFELGHVLWPFLAFPQATRGRNQGFVETLEASGLVLFYWFAGVLFVCTLSCVQTWEYLHWCYDVTVNICCQWRGLLQYPSILHPADTCQCCSDQEGSSFSPGRLCMVGRREEGRTNCRWQLDGWMSTNNRRMDWPWQKWILCKCQNFCQMMIRSEFTAGLKKPSTMLSEYSFIFIYI